MPGDRTRNQDDLRNFAETRRLWRGEGDGKRGWCARPGGSASEARVAPAGLAASDVGGLHRLTRGHPVADRAS